MDLDGRFFVPAYLEDGILHLAHVGRGAHVLDTLARGRLVDQVDGFVGQEAVADIAVGQVGGGFESLVGDAHLMVRLIALAESRQDLPSLEDTRLFDQDLLETSLKGGILGQVLSILIQSGGPDGLQLSPRQGRLENGSRIDGTFGGARPHQIVDLIDEEDDVAALADLFHDLLEALFELAPILRPGHQGTQVEGVDLLVFEQAGHIVLGDTLGQSLYHRRLADTGLAHQHGVVLRAPREDLHDALDLRLPSDHRVELVLLGVLGEIAPELIEDFGRLAVLALASGARRGPPALPAGRTGQHPHDLLAYPVGVDLQVVQDPRSHPFALPYQSQQDMLGTDVVVPQGQSLAQRPFQHLLGPRCKRDLALRLVVALPYDADHLSPHLFEADFQGAQHSGGDSVGLPQETEEQMLRPDVVVAKDPSLFLG